MLMTLPDHNFWLLRDQLLVSGSAVSAWLAETDLKVWNRLGGTKSCDAGTDVRMRAHEALLRKQLVLLVFWKKHLFGQNWKTWSTLDSRKAGTIKHQTEQSL